MNLELDLSELVALINPIESKVVNPNILIQNVTIDSRKTPINSNTLFFAFSGNFKNGADYLQDFSEKGGETAIVTSINESIEINQFKVDDVLDALQTIAIAHRKKFNYPVVGITGSNGKTIVKEWLYVTLKDHFNIVRSPKSYNSQIGVALSVLEMTHDHTLGIFEAGISKPGEMEFLEKMIQPTFGIFTGIGEAHGANFESKSQKKNEKFLLFKNAEIVFEPEENQEINSIFNTSASRSNASVIYALSKYLGLDNEMIINKLKNLPEIAMRMERHLGINGSLIINDAYSADINSLESAIESAEKETGYSGIILVLSKFKDSEFNTEKISNILKEKKVSKLIFIDETKEHFEFEKTQYYQTVLDFLNDDLDVQNKVLLIKGAHNSGFQEIVDHFISKSHITRLEIDLSAVRENLGVFRNRISENVKILSMVKAQAYGGGIVEIARMLDREGSDYFGVAYALEGVQLRKAGITRPIIVMNTESSSYEDLIQHKLEPSIFSIKQLNTFITYLIRKGISSYPIHLKIDTGMNRLGFKEKDFEDLLNLLKTQPEVRVSSVFSHLSSADDPIEEEFTLNQIELYKTWTTALEKNLGYSFIKHLANTAATIYYPQAHFDMVRLGIGLFGINNKKLTNSVRYLSQISQIKSVKKGESIGYSRSYIAEENMNVAIVPVGYADGISRLLGNGNYQFYINGIPCSTVGNICMDMTILELPSNDFNEGDEVEIFGEYTSIAQMARTLNTIPYEILAGISSRVQRVYVQE